MTTKKIEKEKLTKTTTKKTTSKISDADISKRAYEIYLEKGNHNETENWHEAEKELKTKK